MFTPHLAEFRQKAIQANLAEYGALARQLRWVSPSAAAAAEAGRARLVAELGCDLSLACKQTKPHIGKLSPG